MTSRKVGKGPLARTKIKLLVEVPQVSAASVADASGFVPNPKIAFINRVTLEFEIHPNSTVTQRDTLQWLATSLATGNSDVVNLIQHGQAIF
jgi:hypothetical protein